ncbi:hypothetical protein AGMMS50276_33530 [Synergistales bacterium]|nr:hypothetical protein AGMMS50276_33530 [Synergistales bacterium]
MNKINGCRVYIETTMFNRYLEEGRDYCRETRLMFEKFKAGILKPFTSVYALEELKKTPTAKKEQMLELAKNYEVVILGQDERAENLADMYVKGGIVPLRYRMDGIHIAMAAIYSLDCIVSLNFKHINNISTKAAVEAINKANDYPAPFICTPMEVNYDDHD